MARIAQRFEELLDAYRRPDGKRWRGADIVEAAGGVVTRSYVSALRKGNIDSPGYDKLRAIAKAMDFPVEMWFELAFEKPAPRLEPSQNETPFAERLERLFEAIFDEKRGRLYTNADVARMSAGGISEERVAGIRSGEVANPTLDELLALAEAFGVSPSYFTERQAPLLSHESMEALKDADSEAILHKTLSLTEGEKKMVLNIINQLGHLNHPSGDASRDGGGS